MASDSPAAVRRLDDEHPGPLGQARVAGCAGDDLSQLLDDTQLLLSVERAYRRRDLRSSMVARAGSPAGTA